MARLLSLNKEQSEQCLKDPLWRQPSRSITSSFSLIKISNYVHRSGYGSTNLSSARGLKTHEFPSILATERKNHE